MPTDPLINIGQAALDALGMGDRQDVSEIQISILPNRFPSVTVTTEHINPDGLGSVFTYVANHFVLVPKDEAPSITFP